MQFLLINYMRLLSILLSIVFAGILFAVGANAQVEYTNGVVAFRNCDGIDVLNGCYDVSHPFNSRVACSPDNSRCVMLVYENRSDIKSIQVKYSTGVGGKHFENLAYGCAPTGFGAWWDSVFGGCVQAGSIAVDYTSYLRGFYDNFNLPYDVMYYNGNFYVMYVNPIGGLFDPETYFKKVNSTGVYTQVSGAYQDPYTVHQYGMGFCQDGTARFLTLRVPNGGYTVSQEKGTSLDCNTYDFQFTGGATLSHPYEVVSVLDLFNSSYVVNVDSPTFHGSTFRVNYSLGVFPSNYTGLDYYYGGEVHFQNEYNASWVTHTNDFITYLNTSVYYPWPAGYYFNITDTAVDNNNRIYTYEFFPNITTIDGVYVYNQPVYTFALRARGLDLNTMTIVPLTVSAALVCNGGSWYYPVSGVDPNLVTPCLTNNTIFITVAGWQPNTVFLNGMDVLNPVGLTYITAPANGLGWVNPYSVTFGVFDKFAGQPLAGATINVNGDSEVTDAYGRYVYTLDPYQTANFYLFNSSSTYYLSLFGTPKSYDVVASKTGYITSTVATINFTGGTPSGNSSFLRTYNTQLEPLNARLVVDVWWSDGIHYNGDTAVVRVGGNNGNTYLESGSVRVLQNYATSFPAIFILQDNRTSWTAVTNITDGSYFDNATISVTSSTLYYFKDFYLPNSSTTHACVTDLGCGGSFCLSNNWYHNGRCISGSCVYDFQSCILCDDGAGCYSEVTNTTCPTGLDSECVGLNYCIDTKNLASYKCSSSNYCFKSVEVCGYMCDATEKVCLGVPAVITCDQSTPTGLLHCMQAGVMSFIGSTYNPVFVLMVVVFLCIMIPTIIVLIVKGVMSATK